MELLNYWWSKMQCLQQSERMEGKKKKQRVPTFCAFRADGSKGVRSKGCCPYNSADFQSDSSGLSHSTKEEDEGERWKSIRHSLFRRACVHS